MEPVIGALMIPKYFSPEVIMGGVDISNLKVFWSNVDFLLGDPSSTQVY